MESDLRDCVYGCEDSVGGYHRDCRAHSPDREPSFREWPEDPCPTDVGLDSELQAPASEYEVISSWMQKARAAEHERDELRAEVELLNRDKQRWIDQEERMRGALVEAGTHIMRNHTGAASTAVYERITAALR